MQMDASLFKKRLRYSRTWTMMAQREEANIKNRIFSPSVAFIGTWVMNGNCETEQNFDGLPWRQMTTISLYNQINANVPLSGVEINVKWADRNVMFTSSSQWGWCVTADSEAWLGFDCGALKPWWRRPDVLCSPGAGRRVGTSPTLKKKKKTQRWIPI